MYWHSKSRRKQIFIHSNDFRSIFFCVQFSPNIWHPIVCTHSLWGLCQKRKVPSTKQTSDEIKKTNRSLRIWTKWNSFTWNAMHRIFVCQRIVSCVFVCAFERQAYVFFGSFFCFIFGANEAHIPEPSGPHSRRRRHVGMCVCTVAYMDCEVQTKPKRVHNFQRSAVNRHIICVGCAIVSCNLCSYECECVVLSCCRVYSISDFVST